MYSTHHIVVQNQNRRRRNAAVLLAAKRPLYRDLISQAKRKLKSLNPQLSVIYAHAATELCLETVLSDLFKAKGIASLEEPFFRVFRSRDLNNEQLRDVFNALTGERIQDQPFWQTFKEHAKVRHEIVHRGRHCSEAEGAASIQTASALVDYVENTVKAICS